MPSLTTYKTRWIPTTEQELAPLSKKLWWRHLYSLSMINTIPEYLMSNLRLSIQGNTLWGIALGVEIIQTCNFKLWLSIPTCIFLSTISTLIKDRFTKSSEQVARWCRRLAGALGSKTQVMMSQRELIWAWGLLLIKESESKELSTKMQDLKALQLRFGKEPLRRK